MNSTTNDSLVTWLHALNCYNANIKRLPKHLNPDHFDYYRIGIGHTLPKLKPALTKFFDNYVEEVTLGNVNKRIRHKKQNLRQCRFCNKAYLLPHTRFSNDAHIIPEFLGNKHLTSDFECDSCNNKFSLWENDFRNYLGIIPTVTRTIGKKNKIPKTKSVGIVVGGMDGFQIDNELISIFKNEVDNQNLQFDLENGITTLNFKKNKYTPLNVYKCLLKMGLSCLNNKDVRGYRLLLAMLYNGDDTITRFAKVHLTQYKFLSVFTPTPSITLYRRNGDELNIPKHFCIFQYQHLVYQFYLPLHENDYSVYENGKNDIPVRPPIFTDPVDDKFDFSSTVEDFTSAEKNDLDFQHWAFKLDAKIDDWIAFDPTTGSNIEINPKSQDMVGFLIAPKGTAFLLKKK